MKRVGSCNMCGECCGSLKTDGTRIGIWKNYDESNATPELIKEYYQEHPFYMLVNTDKDGKVFIGGKVFPYVKREFICKSDDNISCPFLIEGRSKEKPCGVYGTAYHKLWERCSRAPTEYMTTSLVEHWFNQYPSCSYIYIEDDD